MQTIPSEVLANIGRNNQSERKNDSKGSNRNLRWKMSVSLVIFGEILLKQVV